MNTDLLNETPIMLDDEQLSEMHALLRKHGWDQCADELIACYELYRLGNSNEQEHER
jgi:hypothetical protein